MKIPLFDLGFRPFFLAASLSAVVLILLWFGVYLFSINWSVFNYYPSSIWHAHEMLFGYVLAIITGFLLTAIANWTSLRTVHGGRLAFLVLIWILGRVVPFITVIPGYVIALVDISFLLLFIYYVAQPLIQSANKRNYFIIVMLVGFCLINTLLHLSLLEIVSLNPSNLLMMTVYLIITLISVMAGRVFPMFSQNGVDNSYQAKKYKWIERLTVPSVLTLLIADTLFNLTWLLFITSLSAFLIHIIRLLGWYNHQIWQKPLIWVLHVGYVFLPVGFVLIALSCFYPQINNLAIHALTIGAIGIITLGMIARVSLGHTGRDIHKPAKVMLFAFLSLILAVIMRVFMPIFFPNYYLDSIFISAILWIIGFSIFLAKYSFMLIRPRINES